MNHRTIMTALVAALTLVGVTASNSHAQTARQVSFGNLISALNNIAVQVGNLEALNDLTVGDVSIVKVGDVLNNNKTRITALNNALNRNNVEILNLTNVLNDNEVIKNALNDNNVNVSDVIAIDVLSGGDVIIFQR